MKSSLTVCILTAGKGTRMGKLGSKLNKALHPINGKAIISIIIEKFPSDSEFVIAIGYLGHQVKNYLKMAHPQINFLFVDVKNFDGNGSGPGLSLLQCKCLLQKPFYFVSCDTLWSNNINLYSKENWLGVSSVDSRETKNYCNVQIKNNEVIDIIEKKVVKGNDFKSFVGLCFIYNYFEFWNGIEKKNLEGGEHQISSGLRELMLKSKIELKDVDWEDVGEESKFKKIASKYENFDFSKDDEVLYILNNKVIKFFSDQNITSKRVYKSSLNKKVFPSITIHKKQFYSYNFIKGETLYKINNEKIFRNLLDWLKNNLWAEVKVSNDKMKKTCHNFYKLKTLERISLYNKKYNEIKHEIIINQEIVPNVIDLMDSIPWENLYDGKPMFIHGDLQFDNIIYDSTSNNFCLIDWRQDFAGNIEFGDLYYDLAKLYGGIILNYDFIKLNLFSYKEDDSGINFDFAQRYKRDKYLRILTEFINSVNLDLSKVKLLVGLIYLNMAPLHKYPFDKFLYSLGKITLKQNLSDQNINL